MKWDHAEYGQPEYGQDVKMIKVRTPKSRQPSRIQDGDQLAHYYDTSTGRMVRHLIARKLAPVMTSLYPAGRDDLAVATLGYMRPYLKYIADHYPHVINLHAADCVAAPWPPSGSADHHYRSRQVHVMPSSLPLLDASLDALFVMHGLEHAPDADAMIDEAWRVLKSQGSLVLVVPHRGSIWASRDDTPFGMGQPYSINQLKSLLKAHDFEIGKIHQSLNAPPSTSTLYPRYAPFVERLPNPFGGVLIVEARKMIYAIKGKTSLERSSARKLAKARSMSSSRPISHQDNHH